MKNFDLEDYKLEIRVLQQKDTMLAKENGHQNKKSWFEFIRTQDNDEIADAIIDVARRYDIPLERAAYDFDSTMIMRVGHILKKQDKIKKSKAA